MNYINIGLFELGFLFRIKIVCNLQLIIEGIFQQHCYIVLGQN